jgi:hypothetical protein
MRFFAVAADVAMGTLLGLFLFAGLNSIWPSTRLAAIGAVVVAASILIVLFRQPHGSLAVRQDRR